MITDPKILEEAKGHIKFLLRQMDPAVPTNVPMSSRLESLVDEDTAQKLYEDVIKELEEKTGMKIERTHASDGTTMN
jgi:hypothetical protein